MCQAQYYECVKVNIIMDVSRSILLWICQGQHYYGCVKVNIIITIIRLGWLIISLSLWLFILYIFSTGRKGRIKISELSIGEREKICGVEAQWKRVAGARSYYTDRTS